MIKIQTKTKRIVGVSFGILILPIIFFIKLDSSLGRLLIYKINLNILKHHYLTGVGFNHYGITYNQYQALYFKAGHYSQKELLLAGNVRYAYNDYIQFILETGLLGFLSVLFFFYCIIFLIHRTLKYQSDSLPSLILLFIGQIISFSVAAFFRPVFYEVFFLTIFLTSLIVVVSYSFYKSKPFIKALIANVFIIGSVLLFYQGSHILYYKSYERYREAKDLLETGYLNESLQIFDSLYPDLKKDCIFLDSYSAALVRTGNYDKAIPVLKLAMQLSGSIPLYIRLADCYYNKRCLKDAENLYLIAVYTVPNRFLSRFYLYHFYRNTHQSAKAIRAGKDILNLPVKVPSFQVEQIKQTVRKELNL
jgi:hypothetical protein